MKKTLSLVLAALLLASSLAACNNTEPTETGKTETSATETAISETDIDETNSAETKAPAEEQPETEASSPAYVTDKITENGEAKAHIVVPDGTVDGADNSLEKYASEELAAHIKMVSGADVAVTNTVQSDSLPIIIATPDSYPELEELFPEDLAWLRDTGDGAKVRFGDDGFAIRLRDNKLYIFGANARGALNGVYDFIEDNMGVLWIRSDEKGTIYDEMPTITLDAVDYREKSPFELRSYTYECSWNMDSKIMYSRNKINAVSLRPYQLDETYPFDDVGLEPFVTNHNVKWWIQNSPSYDASNCEYWSTNSAGDHVGSASLSVQVNFWSDVTMQCVADSILSFLDKYYDTTELNYIGINLEDLENPSVYPEMKQPYEYAEGQFADPSDLNYISTVYYSFLNKIARIVGEKYPDVKLHSYAYACVIAPPSCEIEDNLYITICPIEEDLLNPIGESAHEAANREYQYLLGWAELTPNVQVYNYYGTFVTSYFFERPIWDRIQSDLQLYAANGFNGMVPECSEATPGNQNWEMNAMTYWIYSKLAWNPYEDVEALAKYFCEKVYGDAAEYMLEYYRIVRMGLDDGIEMMNMEFNCCYYWYTPAISHWTYFLDIEVDGVYIVEAIQEALHKAYDAANDVQKERIKYMLDIYDNAEEYFNT